jgi:hypothetical protein
MILLWEQLVLHYGAELGAHRWRFEEGHQTTYALLCCRFAPGGDYLRYNANEHAEIRLLESDMWTEQIPRALENWTDFSSRIVVTMAVNRSPCRGCARRLADALMDLHHRFPVRCDRNRFLLASRGAYEDRAMKISTTMASLAALRDAGWELCVLQVGQEVEVGRQLRIALERMGIGRGIVRLSD